MALQIRVKEDGIYAWPAPGHLTRAKTTHLTRHKTPRLADAPRSFL
ncbi:MAG: hypothetical protein J7M16_02090 [Anaerolineae bacterium]|nr:hypothetical protein [Anaerolineae bacterium]